MSIPEEAKITDHAWIDSGIGATRAESDALPAGEGDTCAVCGNLADVHVEAQ